jgi:hypothetical protein
VGNFEIRAGLSPAGDVLARQAHACARAYVRHTAGAGHP